MKRETNPIKTEQEKWDDWERLRGRLRYEVLVPVRRVIQFFKWLFKKGGQKK